ncbi:hypothetical protein NPIL_475991 [Nephila pilipes]|uniref:DDE-1 domain-containing protein n=1 Tax=Nephila pilipes TaxID=299642 RepID=A0A8X6TBX2_NEPPI|nr:hypothetical protein NPIL_475991 [Nephila pilipes]
MNEETVERRKEELPNLVEGYNPKNIFNYDETELYPKLYPTKTVAFKGGPHHSRKKSKERLSVLLCCNTDENESVDQRNESENLLNDISEDDWLVVYGGHSTCTFD